MFSIRRKLLVLAIAPLIVTVATILILLQHLGQQYARISFERTAQTQHLLIVKRADYFFQAQADAVRSIATIPAMQTGDLKQILPALQRVHQRGWQVPWHDLGYGDTSGNVTGLFGPPINIKDRTYFKELMAGRAITAFVAVSLGTGASVLISAAPVFDASQNVTGMVLTSILAKDAANAIMQPVPQGAALVALVDEREDDVLTAMPDKGGVEQQPMQAVRKSTELSMILDVAKKQHGLSEATLEGRQVLVYSARLPSIGWPLALVYPAALAYEGLAQFQGFAGIVLVMALLWVGLLTSFLSRRFVRPITQIIDGFQHVGAGRLDVQVPVHSRDELGQLTQSFNAMVVSLRNAVASSIEESSEKEKLLTIIEKTPHAVGIADIDGGLFYLNPSARDMLRTHEGSVALGDLYADDSKRALLETAIPHTLRYGLWRGEATLLARDGGTLPVALTMIRHDEGAHPVYISFIARDITPSKVLESELRTAKERAESANRSKDTFLNLLSHELLTPLTTIFSSLELLTLDVHDIAALESARRGAARLRKTLKRIFQFMDLLSWKLHPDEELLSLDALLRAVIADFVDEALAKRVTLQTSVDSDITDRFIADKNTLQVALSELVDNGVKYTSQGIVSLKVTKLKDKGVYTYLRFTVADTGVGIAVDRRERIFQAFQQGENALAREHGGLGIGLALVKLAAARLNGEIGLESRLGAGSQFWLDVVFKTDRDT